jgi:hypothetical protein
LAPNGCASQTDRHGQDQCCCFLKT